MIEEKLHEIAEEVIPAGKHELFHVHAREEWVNSVMALIKLGALKKNDKEAISILAHHWESLLAGRYSQLN
jgi:hypothetical protein